MEKQIDYTNLQILTTKDIANILKVSESTAKNYIKDIKTELGVKKINLQALRDYFNPYKNG